MLKRILAKIVEMIPIDSKKELAAEAVPFIVNKAIEKYPRLVKIKPELTNVLRFIMDEAIEVALKS